MAKPGKSPTNPFRFGGLALDEAFADREPEVEELKHDVLNGQDVVIFAPRRYGKSSLVWRSMQQLVGERVLVAHVNLMTTPTKDGSPKSWPRRSTSDIASPLARAKDRPCAPFRGLRIEPDDDGQPRGRGYSFSFRVGHPPRHRRDARAAARAARPSWRAHRGHPGRPILDEFQEVVDHRSRLPKLLRSVFQHQPEVAHVYLGSRRHMMERIFNDENEPFWRSAKKIELGRSSRRALRRFIRERFRATKRTPRSRCRRGAPGPNGGHPYATQELCYFLWEQTPFDGGAGAEELEAALAGCCAPRTRTFRCAGATPRRAEGRARRRSPTSPGARVQDYRPRHELPAPAPAEGARRAAPARTGRARSRGRYCIAEPFFAEWILALDEPDELG